MDDIVAREEAAGRKPYAIPLGGSNALGASAYAHALEEVLGQTRQKFDRIVLASSSGGTQAGLVAGARRSGFGGQILGISIDEPEADLQEMVAGIADEVAGLLGIPGTFAPHDVRVNADYLGAGYGIVGNPEREAIHLFARTEGLLLDPVYTGRAAAGLIDLIRRGEIGRNETILFWHTGGTPALWAYGREL
jgi:1-aminocyclopropane-1-carboxylate deaminase/D-cysteine desulfhydrase-like pyridoxal-dependent ACC family enzyme